MITYQEKQDLIIELEFERNRFLKKSLPTIDHDYAIHYLKTGETNGDIGEHEILMACVEDLDQLYADYCK